MKNKTQPTSKELVMQETDIIVSKTDTKGRLTYGNEKFIEFSGFAEADLLGQQHNIVRHPDMPRGIFKFLWDNISQGKELFAYVKNMSKDGSFYWVMANVTPDYDASGKIVGYFSVRRAVSRSAIQTIDNLYRQMLEAEKQAGARDACDASLNLLSQILQEKGMTYEQFILSV